MSAHDHKNYSGFTDQILKWNKGRIWSKESTEILAT